MNAELFMASELSAQLPAASVGSLGAITSWGLPERKVAKRGRAT